MIERPDEFISAFAEAGVNWILSIRKPAFTSTALSI